MKKHLTLIAAIFLILPAVFSPSARAAFREPYPMQPKAPVWQTYDAELRYYYQQLSDVEKRGFSARYDAIALGDGTLWSGQVQGLNEIGWQRVNFVLINDCPELMYFSMTLSMGYYFIQVPDDAYLAAHPAQMAQMNSACAGVVQSIREEAASGSDFDLEMALIDRMTRLCTYRAEQYGEDTDETIRTAYSSLVAGEAVCSGYAAGFLYAMRCLGIPCAMMNGVCYDESGQGAGHQWNVVRINGTWTHVDVTWSDADEEAPQEDFYPDVNLTSLEIRRERSDDTERGRLHFTVPQCTSNAENYYVKHGRILGENWREELPALIREAAAAGRTALGVRAATKEIYEQIVSEWSSVIRFGTPGFPGQLNDLISYDPLFFFHFSW